MQEALQYLLPLFEGAGDRKTANYATLTRSSNLGTLSRDWSSEVGEFWNCKLQFFLGSWEMI